MWTTAVVLLVFAGGTGQEGVAQSVQSADGVVSNADGVRGHSRTGRPFEVSARQEGPLEAAVRVSAQSVDDRSFAAWPDDRFSEAVRPPKVDAHRAAGSNLPDVSRRVVALTNEERTERNRRPLDQLTQLALIACRHNKDMLANDYAGHEDADGRQVGDRLFREHRTLLVTQYGENVQQAWGKQVRQAGLAALPVEGWMESPPHRKNILNRRYTHLGACVTRADDKMRSTQVFARVAGELDEPLPWSMSAGDSLATALRAAPPDAEFERYGFQRVGSDDKLDFDQTAPFDGTIRVPSEPGRYELRMLYVKGEDGRSRTYHYSSGPRIRVTSP